MLGSLLLALGENTMGRNALRKLIGATLGILIALLSDRSS
jgi:hypothetical protein